MIKRASIFLLILSMCLANGARGPGDTSEAAGEYVFPAPTGEVEVLILKSDSTYRQELYSDVAGYTKGTSPLHTNTATWKYSGSAFMFDRWLGFRDFLNPGKRLNPPKLMLSLPAHWDPPSKKCDAVILVAEELPYVFVRVKNRVDGARILAEGARARNGAERH